MSAESSAGLAALQRRTVRVLAAGQVLSGVAFGATVSLGALLAADLSGNEALSGFATAATTLGAAICAIPLARLAAAKGRRFALTLGNLFAVVGVVVVVTSAAVRAFPLLLVGILLIGAGNAGTLQSRFAATDLAEPEHRAAALSRVVWSTTVGGVLGPLLLTPGERLGALVGMPPLTGAYLFSFVAGLAAFALYLVALRPDPLLTAQRLAREGRAAASVDVEDRPRVARFAIIAVSCSHVVMASVMAMTPVHLAHLAHAGGRHDEVTWIVGVTIAAHVFGMYGLSPLFGALADRIGRVPVILTGQAVLASSLLFAFFAGEQNWGVFTALVLLGLGWSASTVAGSALLTDATPIAMRPARQGTSDSLMTFSAAIGAVLAGAILAGIGYGGLALVALVLVVAVAALSPLGRRG